MRSTHVASSVAAPPAVGGVGDVHPRRRGRSSTASLAARGHRIGIGSSSDGSFTIAVVNARDAHASATSAARARSSSARLGARGVGMRVDRTRASEHRAVVARRRRSARSQASGRRSRRSAVVPAGHCGSVAYPEPMPRVRVAAAQLDLVVGDLEGNVAASSTPTSGPKPPAATWWRSPSWRSPGTRPKTSCCGRRSSRSSRVAREDRRPHRTHRGGRRVPRGRPRPLQLGRAVRATGVSRACTASTSCRTTRCSTRSATSSRGPPTARCSSSAACASRVTVCEDAWSPSGPILTQAAGGAELVVNINASPYYAGRLHERETMLATRAADAGVPVLYVNLVGGQDELVFDGASMLFDESGHLVARAAAVRRRPAHRRRRRAARVPAPAARSARSGARGTRCRGRGDRGAARRAPRGAAASSRC